MVQTRPTCTIPGGSRLLRSNAHTIWIAIGSILIAVHVALLLLSREFWHGRDVLERPVLALVALMIASGLVYLAGAVLVRRSFKPDRWWWMGMLFVGIAMRTLMLPSVPMLDDDYYRYLWDGGRVAQGQSPYEIAPKEVSASTNPSEITALTTVSREVADRVNHPSLRSIYPPIAQFWFAAAHFAAPWSIGGLRFTWLVADLTTLGLLAMLLRTTGVPLRQLMIYWWNPLLVKETYNTAHMDILVLPFVVGGLVLAVRHRHNLATIALAFGVGVKLWPILLLPVVLRHRNMGMRAIVRAASIFAVVASVAIAPFLLSSIDSTAGLYAYASGWEMNDSVYVLLYSVGSWVTPATPHVAARSLIAVLLLGAAVSICRTPATDGLQVCRRGLCMVAALFLIGPTQFPWYWIWLLPMLAVTPVYALILLTATLPLYYLHFTMDALGYTPWFDYGVVWIEFGPTLVILAWTALRNVRTNLLAREQWNLVHER